MTRRQLGALRDHSMARRPGEEGRISLSPRARLIVGWLAAVAVIVAIALVVGVLGGNGDGAPVAPNPTPSPSGSPVPEIAFGTALDPATGEVPTEVRTDRFASTDTFAYSAQTDGSPPPTVYVGVERVAGGDIGVVQNPTPEGEQRVPPERAAIAFTVPASNLFDVFGPGEYVMRIYVDPTEEPIATGRFVLVAEAVPASAVESAQP